MKPAQPTAQAAPVSNKCSDLLRQLGVPYPRTCRVCGLGPCRWPEPAQPQHERKPLSYEEINAIRKALPADIEDMPEPWAFRQGFRAAERHHGISASNGTP